MARNVTVPAVEAHPGRGGPPHVEGDGGRPFRLSAGGCCPLSASWLIAASVGLAALLAAVGAQARDDDTCRSKRVHRSVRVAARVAGATVGVRVEAKSSPAPASTSSRAWAIPARRRSWLGVLNVGGLTPEMAKLWEINPATQACAGLVGVFWSKLIDDSDAKSAVGRTSCATASRRMPRASGAADGRDVCGTGTTVRSRSRNRGEVRSSKAARARCRRSGRWPSTSRAARGRLADCRRRVCDPGRGSEADDRPASRRERGRVGVRAGLLAAGRFAWLERRRAAAASTSGCARHGPRRRSRAGDGELHDQAQGLVGLCALRAGGPRAHRTASRAAWPDAGAAAAQRTPWPSSSPARAEAAAGHVARSHPAWTRWEQAHRLVAGGDAPPGENAAGRPRFWHRAQPLRRRVAVVVAQRSPGTGRAARRRSALRGRLAKAGSDATR